jgi:hypothetical protein
VPADLRRKHAIMRGSAFGFLRATYWRWAETVLDACPDLARAPAVLAVGDIHLENFGTWRDADGRLVWGVNDVDEAAEMPFVLDLVRLATSAILARRSGLLTAEAICAAILRGYRAGLKAPEPLVLDEDWRWLRWQVAVDEAARSAFWARMGKLMRRQPAVRPPARFVRALQHAVPEPPLKMHIAPRSAGAGSRGRLRLVGIAPWRGGLLVREAKVAAPSAWTRPSPRGGAALLIDAIATGPFRCPDPWYALHGDVLVRRLSPNNRKIELDRDLPAILRRRMLGAMGRELASIHRGTSAREPLREHLRDLPARWLLDAARRMAQVTEADFRAYKGA